MSVVETVLVFVVVPAVIVGVIALSIWGGGTRGPRYRPGREWPYEPVWYAPHPLAVPEPEHDSTRTHRPELAPAPPGTAPEIAHTAAGGARGIW